MTELFVRYRCNCIADVTKGLILRCTKHNAAIKDWASDYRSPLRVVIHWQDGKAGFALHKVEYDQHGFIASIEEQAATAIFPTTAELATDARRIGFSMEEVSNIFYDRYLEYKEFE
ncbi:MAG: hypothetical protein JNN15_10720 [Blastocatellia bacterium]|nr:hypothetical protein [Blastocatellia bacterium]